MEHSKKGPGRPKKERSKQDYFPDAESYLTAVVQGLTKPDAVRVGAARTMLAYQKARVRGPVLSLPPQKLAEQTARDQERASIEDYERKAAIIIAEHERRQNGNQS